ncbi:hypothetical protein [Halochromatium glycolicum]|nr:hypothetical protein [Halochromatium glycolicum]
MYDRQPSLERQTTEINLNRVGNRVGERAGERAGDDSGGDVGIGHTVD